MAEPEQPTWTEPALAQSAPEAGKAVKPPLKWAGGKRWLAPILRPLWETHRDRRLVEPFCGGLAITLTFRPRQAQLNDFNPHLINFYRWLRKGLQIEIPLRNEKSYYYTCRQAFNNLTKNGGTSSKEAAELFYYLNRTGYNGLCRFNRKGEFNVPFGRHKSINYQRDFSLYRKILADWEFHCEDFETMDIDPEDFIYADPPYDVEFRQYARTGFTWEDQVRLAEWLARHPGPVVLSNQATPRILELYEKYGFQLKFLDGPRRISRTGDRTPAREVLALKGV